MGVQAQASRVLGRSRRPARDETWRDHARRSFAWAALVLSLAGGGYAHADYLLQPGDKLEILVWKETDLQRTVVVRPDGKFSFPLAGEISTQGRSVDQIRTEIETRLKQYISEPVVTVTLSEIGGNRIFVIGQVNKPGMFLMNPQLNVLQALSLAGGTTAFAKVDEIMVIRGSGPEQTTLRFNYGQVSGGRNLAQNVFLESGDVVLVP